jgi:hypothetical protein
MASTSRSRAATNRRIIASKAHKNHSAARVARDLSMAISSEKNDQSYRNQPDEGVAPHHRENERGHTTLLSGEIVTDLRNSCDQGRQLRAARQRSGN